MFRWRPAVPRAPSSLPTLVASTWSKPRQGPSPACPATRRQPAGRPLIRGSVLAVAGQAREHGGTYIGGAQLLKEAALTETTAAPGVTGFHHFSPTVSDVEASAR